MTPVRTATIVWGAILLLLGAAAFALVAWDIDEVADFSLVHVIVGAGALLVLAAAVGALAGATRKRAQPAVPSSPPPADQPVD